jgi:diguanylate cyclase (GGDEF)-like protein
MQDLSVHSAHSVHLSQKPAKILVVDDDRSMRLLLKLAMEEEGYEVFEAQNGEQCLTEFVRHQPQMVLLDAVMPDIDGFTCCRQLRSQVDGGDIPILMITVLDDPESVDFAYEAGATDYVTKPIHWPVLCQRVSRLLKAHWAMQQLQEQYKRERLLTEQLEMLNTKLQHLAMIDELTQLANRRYFDDVIEREWQRSQREQTDFSMLMFDIDNFKVYNDTYGHIAGDTCLTKVARLATEVVGDNSSLLARYGGEEFAIILPGIDGKSASNLANLLRNRIMEEALPNVHAPHFPFVTVSIGGFSTMPNQQMEVTEAIARADEALYQAKRNGRNCVRFDFGD